MMGVKEGKRKGKAQGLRPRSPQKQKGGKDKKEPIRTFEEKLTVRGKPSTWNMGSHKPNGKVFQGKGNNLAASKTTTSRDKFEN